MYMMLGLALLLVHPAVCALVFFGIAAGALKVRMELLPLVVFVPLWGVVCVLSGTGEYAYSDRTVELLSAGSVALIPPTTAYSFQVPPDCPCCLHCTVNFLADDSFLSMLEPDRLCVFRPADFHHFQCY